MELVVIFTTLCISLSMLLTHCVSIQIHQQAIADDTQFSLPSLPRKLRIVFETPVSGHGGQASTSNNEQKGDESGKSHHKEQNQVIKGSKSSGTRQEWLEGTDTFQFFTMDYSHVRRRRPIHNKSLPVGP